MSIYVNEVRKNEKPVEEKKEDAKSSKTSEKKGK